MSLILDSACDLNISSHLELSSKSKKMLTIGSRLVRNNTAALWDGEMGKYCCGDFVLALGLKSFGIDLQHAWPMFTGERPSTIPFNDRLDYWCGPAVSFHHLGPEDMETFAEFEESRPNKTVCLLISPNVWLC